MLVSRLPAGPTAFFKVSNVKLTASIKERGRRTNHRDFIFVRHHRYTFENEKKARLQEIGPRFTLKMRWLQQGTFDTKFGEYEWIHKQHQLDTSRRKFHL
jgi:ribosome production factor 1